jgi:hypothetical protein
MLKRLMALVTKLIGMLLVLCASVYTGTAVAEGGGHASHVIGQFVGQLDTETEDSAVVGVEYEYRFSNLVGVGAVLETAPQAHHGEGESVGLLVVHLHPIGDLRLTAGAGKERAAGHSETLYRVGAGYDFSITKRFAIGPTANVDYIDSDKVYVYGLVFSTHFQTI